MAKISFGGHELLRAAKKFEEDLMEKVSDIVYETARLIESQAKALAPVDDGSLKQSIEMRMEGKYKAVVTVGAHYAIFVNYGTGIYAMNNNGRRTPWTYYSTKLGRFVTTHGSKPQMFWEPAVEAGEQYFMREMRKLGL